MQAAPYSFKDGDEVKTINLKMGHLKGQKHPVTGVPYDKDGFPIFDSKFNAKIDESLYDVRDRIQFKEGTRQLQEHLLKSPELKKMFTDKQLQDIEKGKTPNGFTWHHHQDKGILQLVDKETHRLTGHTGGRAIWGGGPEKR
ncbi:HNH endonuclease [Camelliibacillus cellulosilyticus]|uniref:HNH endonuclease n=1 Tax=Camelliibacillus cellulosilyticus TaxID=2174486 RepID=A0ABV9GTS8_9BACL